MSALKRVVALVLLLCGLCGVAAAQEPIYASTRAFAAMLRQADVPFEAQGVDEYGEECLCIALEGGNLYCFFPADEAEVCFVMWYLIEYAPASEAEVLQACNRLNAASDGPRFYADGSDCTVTVMLDVALPWDAAGDVAWKGYRCMANMVREGRRTLASLDITPRETPQPTATPAPVMTATPSPAPTRAAIATPVPTPEQPARVVITAPTARVRSGPGVNSPYLCTVRQGEAFPVLGVNGDWYIISCDGRTGFVSRTVAVPE